MTLSARNRLAKTPPAFTTAQEPAKDVLRLTPHPARRTPHPFSRPHPHLALRVQPEGDA
ncbi:hypothetical protein N9I05_04150 [Pseudomonadales bacterium]|nr:hypothetical protein [Pseudomonadales bacterium]